MKHIYMLLVFLLAGCGAVRGATSAPNEAPDAHCERGVCIQKAYLTLSEDGDDLRVEFSLTDESGKIEVGKDYAFSEQVSFALYSGDTYLIGLAPDLDLFSCYTGNDFPWANGKLAAACGILLPANKMAERVEAGQKIRVETIGYGSFNQTTKVEQGK